MTDSDTGALAASDAFEDVDFDLDAFVSETTRKPYRFKVAGERFELPSGRDADWQALTALDRGDLEGAFLKLLGPEAYAKFTAHKVSADRMGELIKRYMMAQGVKPGESEASTGS